MTKRSPTHDRAQQDEARLDQAILALREDAPDPDSLDAAASRVRQILNQEMIMSQTSGTIAGCEGYQALIPAYLAGELPAGRTLLFEDHSRGCVACRRALAAARAEARGIAPVAAPAARPEPRRTPIRWALAAALMLAAGLAGWQLLGPSTAMAEVEAADGGLYRIEEAGAVALDAGATLSEGEVIRTGRAAGSVLTLSDGSRVEVAPRSELSLSERGGDTTIQVTRGDIIVEASDQGSGHLFVNTDDCLVSVTGTVFSVKRGARGSRVSVIEGEVRVKQGAQEQVLVPGDQVSTDPGLGSVPVVDEIAWSRFSEAHVALLRQELSALSRELEDLPRPAPRFGSSLAGELPADSAVVIALPNLSGTLAEANELIESRVSESEVLAAWWQANMADSESEADLRMVIDHLSAVGEQIGEEILVAMAVAEDGEPNAPLVMGSIENPEAFRKALTDEVSAFSREVGEDLPLRFVDDPAQVEIPVAADAADADAASDDFVIDNDASLLVWVGSDRFAMSPEPAAMRRLASGGTLAGSDFHAAITSAYAEGVEWLFAADMPRLVGKTMAEADADTSAAFDGSGLSGARYLVVRQSEREGITDTRAELSFDGARRGVASWLAEPAAMGALDFIAPEAHVAAAFVTRAPAEILNEMMGLMERVGPDLRAELDEAQAEADLELKSSLVAPLGGEFAFALDGPLLPEPAWKLIVEVYDPAALQAGLERLVARSSEAFAELPETSLDGAPAAGAALDALPRLELTREEARGRTWHTLTETGSGLALHYTFAEGYMVAGSSRAIVERALQYRSSGVNLRTAPNFDRLLARGEDLNVSALMYQNLAPVAAPLGEFLADRAGSAEDMPADESAILSSAAAAGELPATLAWASALPDKLVVSGRSDGGPLGMGLSAILGIDGLVGAPALDHE